MLPKNKNGYSAVNETEIGVFAKVVLLIPAFFASNSLKKHHLFPAVSLLLLWFFVLVDQRPEMVALNIVSSGVNGVHMGNSLFAGNIAVEVAFGADLKHRGVSDRAADSGGSFDDIIVLTQLFLANFSSHSIVPGFPWFIIKLCDMAPLFGKFLTLGTRGFSGLLTGFFRKIMIV